MKSKIDRGFEMMTAIVILLLVGALAYAVTQFGSPDAGASADKKMHRTMAMPIVHSD